MDTRKVTLIATIAAILLLAVGIGYAYTASTLNSGNNATSEYITLIQDNIDSKGAYTFTEDNEKVYWNSEDRKVGDDVKTKYTLTATTSTSVITDYTVVQLGNSFKLKAAPQAGGTAKDTLTCAISAVMAKPTITGASQQAKIFLVVTTNNSASPAVEQKTIFELTAANTFTVMGGSGSSFTIYKTNGSTTTYNDVTVAVYYGYLTEGGIEVTHIPGTPPAGPSQAPLNNASLTFTVTETGSN